MPTFEEGDEEERHVDREVEKLLYELEKRDMRSAGAIPETNGHSHLTTMNVHIVLWMRAWWIRQRHWIWRYKGRCCMHPLVHWICGLLQS